jgi:hypothetical protein
MARDAIPIDVSTMPDLARLVKEVARDGRPRVLREANADVAVISPVRGRAPRRRPMRLVDTSALPPVPYRTFADLVRHRPAPPARSFTDEELKEAIDEARAEAWRAKQR